MVVALQVGNCGRQGLGCGRAASQVGGQLRSPGEHGQAGHWGMKGRSMGAGAITRGLALLAWWATGTPPGQHGQSFSRLGGKAGGSGAVGAVDLTWLVLGNQ